MYLSGRQFSVFQGLKATWVVARSFNFLLFATLLLRPRRLWDVSKDMFASFNAQVKGLPIPLRSLAEILPGGTGPISLFIAPDKQPAISMSELVCLCALANMGGAKNILEIGTFSGMTSYHLAKNTAADAKIFTMDLPEELRAGQALREARQKGKRYTEEDLIQARPPKKKLGYVGTDVEHKVVQIRADSTTFDYARHFSQKFDLIFIDGSHNYYHVKTDSANALKWVADKGFIVWHDYTAYPEIIWGVKRHLNELSRKYNIVRIRGTRLCVLQNTGLKRSSKPSASTDVGEADAR